MRFASMGGAMGVANRAKAARAKAREVLEKTFGRPPGLYITPPGASPSYTDPNPITVRLTRVGPGELDTDGPDDALKSVRDGVADWLGVEDRQRSRDRHLIDWPRAKGETTPAFTTSIQCPMCGVAIGAACVPRVDIETGKPAKMARGIHIARRTPWRVRIEVQDTTPGPDRRVVLASEPQTKGKKRKTSRKRPAAKPDGDPGEELAACMLVACPQCPAPLGEACEPTGGRVFGVHVARATAAGIGITADVFRRMGLQAAARPKTPRTGVRKVVQPRPRPEPAGQGRLALQRCYARLPYEQAPCGACVGVGAWPGAALVDGLTRPGACVPCGGTGIRGMKLAHEDRVDGLRPPLSMAYTVPTEHRARWGHTITLHRRPLKSRELGTIWIYDTKGHTT